MVSMKNENEKAYEKKSFLLSCVIVMCLFISSQVYASEEEKGTKV